ncbi:MAG TPA: TIGR01777 family oxidoreductase [Solirubrobacteraceae bacterium]|nr:TIGR01777 family oxidoreductase [Solirubrobacteraceae bacterium]
MGALRVTVTGATGLIGPQLTAALLERGAEVTVLSRDPDRARARLGDVTAIAWDPLADSAPVEALSGRDAVVHLAGAPVAQRWSAKAKRAIRESRVIGTRNLLAGLAACADADGGEASSGGANSGDADGDAANGGGRPRMLISSSAIGYYGPRGDEPLDEDAPPGEDFLARVCVEWEAEAAKARGLGLRVVQVRTGVVLDAAGGALAKMLTPFRLGVGGPVAGGRQYMSWIHADDLVGMVLAAIEDERWSGPINATAPEPVTNAAFSHALGKALHRPSLLPVPGLALRALYGEMAEIVTTGARAVPAKPLVLGYEFSQPRLEQALRSALGSASR